MICIKLDRKNLKFGFLKIYIFKSVVFSKPFSSPGSHKCLGRPAKGCTSSDRQQRRPDVHRNTVGRTVDYQLLSADWQQKADAVLRQSQRLECSEQPGVHTASRDHAEFVLDTLRYVEPNIRDVWKVYLQEIPANATVSAR